MGAVLAHTDMVGKLGKDLFGTEADPGRDGTQAPGCVRRQPDLRP